MSNMFSESRGLSYALANFRDDEYSVTVIVNAFYEKARQVARSRLDRNFRHLVSGSSIANVTLYAVLESISKRDLASPSAQGLENMLRARIKNRLISRVRYFSAKKRSISRSVPLDDAFHTPVSDDSSAQCIADELYELIADKLHELHGFDLRFRLAELGLLLHMRGDEIRRTLEHEYPGRRIPSVPNIRRKLGHDKEVLRVYLKQVWELEDE